MSYKNSFTYNENAQFNDYLKDVNKSVNRRRKMNILAKLKRDSYQKSSQPVYDMAGESTHMEKMLGLEESVNDKQKVKIDEDIQRIKSFIGYNSKTQ